MAKFSSITENNTIRLAFKRLHGEHGKILAVIDKKKSLLGVISTGDLRRAILDGYNLNDKIKKIYNRNVTYVYKDELEKKKLNKSNFGSGSLGDSTFYVPIVNNNKKVYDMIPVEKVLATLENRKLMPSKKKRTLPKILIVGGGGFIGTVLASKLLEKNYHVTILDKLIYDHKIIKKNFNKKKNLNFILGDVCDLNTQIKAIKEIDIVVYLAEIVGDPACSAKPEDALKTNYLSVLSFAHLCSHLAIDKFIYTSSCSVYGLDKNNKLLNEKSNLNPVSHYARIKIMSEKALLSSSNNYFKPTIVRLGTVFGPSKRMRFDLVVNTMSKFAYFNNKIDVFGGNQWRPNIHVEDVADGIISIIKSKKKKIENQIFNLSNDKLNLQIIDIAEKVKTTFKNAKLNVIKTSTDPRNYKVTSRKIKNKTGFVAKKSIENSLKEIKNMFRLKKIKNPDNKIYNNFLSLK
ncbi:UDP-glucose 4-epimerase [Candidatus Pelagibacter sp. HTCC7211]|uniref:NAD-dependent epimerase/dehydratase family protein n=1 Tax=Pelagibacter sp. (strain HTCC7211) TaxID=439493 RepID=UPI000183A57A|nr:NAD-dependent epimerase/dehydratase family protein [Candidatus Pelagibacter sp. HTCC7211]EDZ60446.1 UDP-glucose 4-epimerase [Candidatus Pelagibacter sp. HTCC7211]MBD1151158.1 NAD-dependent epimerase/dehydratase family protein [Pelagibacterales bacterium SAG-MED25]